MTWIRQGAIGDLLVSLASLEETAQIFPNAKITVLGPKQWLKLLEPQLYSHVARIAVVERRGHEAEIYEPQAGTWKTTERKIGVVDLFRGIEAVVNLNIDSYRYGFAALRAGVRIRIGMASPLMAWLYTHCAPELGKDPVIHERDAALFVLEYARDGWRRFTQTHEKTRRELPARIAQSPLISKWRNLGLPAVKIPDTANAESILGAQGGQYILINPTSSRKTNTWPAERFRALLAEHKDYFKEKNIVPFVVGAPGETEWLQQAAAPGVKVIQPKDLMDLGDVLAGARGLLTNTSSMQFFAASMKVRTVVIMGRANPKIWGPLGPRDSTVRGEPPPELSHDIFAQEQAAYESISIERVGAALRSLVED